MRKNTEKEMRRRESEGEREYDYVGVRENGREAREDSRGKKRRKHGLRRFLTVILVLLALGLAGLYILVGKA